MPVSSKIKAFLAQTDRKCLILANQKLENQDLIELCDAIKQCNELEELNLANNRISCIEPLAAIVSLKHLNIKGNNITHIAPLARIESLTTLNLEGNQIVDVSSLSATSIESVNLSNNKIKTLKFVQENKSIKNLEIAKNEIDDLSPVNKNSTLIFLNAAFNKITNVACIQDNTTLETLYLQGNPIADVTPLFKNIVLHELNAYSRALKTSSESIELFQNRNRQLREQSNPIVRINIFNQFRTDLRTPELPPPSLADLCLFFIRKNKLKLPQSKIPDDLQEKIVSSHSGL